MSHLDLALLPVLWEETDLGVVSAYEKKHGPAPSFHFDGASLKAALTHAAPYLTQHYPRGGRYFAYDSKPIELNDTDVSIVIYGVRVVVIPNK